jgi:hypothetical protein
VKETSGFALYGNFAGLFDGATEHLREVNLQRSGDSQKRFQGGIAHFAFNVTHHLLGQTGSLCHQVHGKPLFFSFSPQKLGDMGANGLLRFVRCHGRKISAKGLDSASHYS